MVSMIYTLHNFFAVSPILGFNFSVVMPVTSELNKSNPP